MKTTYQTLLIIHVLLVFAVAIWLLALGRDDIKKIPKWFTSLTLATMVLSLAMMLVNLLQHNQDETVYLLSPYKYIAKTIIFAVVVILAMKNSKKSTISQGVWKVMIALMAMDFVITGVWM